MDQLKELSPSTLVLLFESFKCSRSDMISFLLALGKKYFEFSDSELERLKHLSTTLCLVMLVKDERLNLPVTLESIVQDLNYWIIHDVGSTDGTPLYLKEYFRAKGIPGQLYQSKWFNFVENRTIAFRTAYGTADYLLFLDAGEQVIIKNRFWKSRLGFSDLYSLAHKSIRMYFNYQIMKSDYYWEYKGVVAHDFLDIPQDKLRDLLEMDQIYINNERKFIHPFTGQSVTVMI